MADAAVNGEANHIPDFSDTAEIAENFFKLRGKSKRHVTDKRLHELGEKTFDKLLKERGS